MNTGMNSTDLWTLLVIAGLAVVTVVTRSFFFLSNKPWHLPHWAQRGLQYAPIAALSAVVVPEIVMSQGQLITTWQDARLFAAAAGALIYFAKRNVLLTILGGMAVYLPLHLVFGF
jgi:branched-subunit amino acid transport protein